MEIELGAKIKKLRLEKGITLEGLASRTKFTKSYLSKIETNQSTPPIGTLMKIAKGLGVDISYFFLDERTEVLCSLVRKEERKKVVFLGTPYGYSYESLAYRKINRKMEVFLVEFPPSVQEITLFQHEGQETLYILEGEMEFIYGDEQRILKEGDCLYFESEIAHGGRSVGNTAVKALAVITSG